MKKLLSLTGGVCPRVILSLVLFALSVNTGPVKATDFYWDTDGSLVGNDEVTGTGLGGSGIWDGIISNWWTPSPSGLSTWSNGSTDNAIFGGIFPALGIPVPYAVTVDSGVTTNKLTFQRSGYTLTGGDLTLAGSGAGFFVRLGERAEVNSQLLGTEGLSLTGGGTIVLNNSGNTYTGETILSNGTVVITNQGALGLDTSAIVIRGFNPAMGSTNLRSFGGGSLFLNGLGGDITFARDLSLQGYGPLSDRGGALISSGVNTLSGSVTMGNPFSGTNLSTRIIAADGTLNLSGPLTILGTAGTTISNLGGVNQAGASFYNVTGTLSGTGTLESSGGGTLFLNPSDASGFSGNIRVSGSAASGQSVVRIDSPNVLGTRTASGTGGVFDMNGGVLAILMDTPSVQSGGVNANVYGRASSTFFADHTPNSSVRDQTVSFGQLAFEENITLTFNSRNGYGMSFTTAPVQGGNNNSTFTNNLQGGAQLTFTGNFWSNTDNGAARTLTIGGNGNTTINGSIVATSTTFDHILTKTGTGTLTLLGTASTLDGTVNVNGGTVAISDWRAITNNTSIVDIGTSTTSATLAIVGNNVSQANLTTSKVIRLGGTTGGATVLANQTGTSPGLIFNATTFATSNNGLKTLTLGGSNLASNTINSIIVDSTSATSLAKIDPGKWVLAGSNTYTGSTTISDGTLQIKANAASSTILADTSSIVFNASSLGYAGGTLELLGLPSLNVVESLGALTPTNGSGTVRLTPGSGGSASLIFASLGTVGGGGTVNFVAPTGNDTVRFAATAISNNIASAGLFYNGSDFAFVPGAGLAVRAPLYGVDADFATSATALTAGQSNEVTGSFSNAAVTIDSLKLTGSPTLTLSGLLTVRTAGTANATGGILQSGGSGTISGTGVTTGGSGALVINVDGAANSLQLDAPITSTTTGGFTKVGAGTLRLGGLNAQTGTISINEGIVRLAGADRLGAGASLNIRQGAILELNGVTPATATNTFTNNGIVRNGSATTPLTYTIGGGNGTGISYGIIEDGGAASLSLVKTGTGAQSWLGLSTYTGTTTIGSTGIVSINNLVNGGSPSGIGASSNDASNLIFTGTSATQAYGGINYTGPTNDETDRLFTFNGGASGGVRIQSNGVNGATSSWTNTGALAFGPAAAGNPQGLVLGGGSTGDNRFSPVISDNGAAATSVYKADAGVWYLEATNTYTGPTTIHGGALYATTGASLPTASNLVLDGGSLARTGDFTRTLGTGPNQVQWTANASGGFSAGGSSLRVDWGTGAVWGTGPFLGTGALLLNNSGVAKSDVDIVSGFEITQGITAAVNATTTAGSATVNLTSGTTAGLAIGQTISGNPNIPTGSTIATIVSATQFTLNSGTGVTAAAGVSTSIAAGGYRQVNVGDFTSIGADFGTISGDITGAGSLAKEGTGILNLRGSNTYTGQTLVRSGTLVVETLGNSMNGAGPTSVGEQSGANTDASALLLGNGGTTAGILEYVGPGETSDRKIRLNTTTGSTQIHADGVGPLILTNVANDMVAGAKTLILRGVNPGGNMITSQLSDNGGALAITVDGSASWVLTNNANDFTGTVSINAGALGVGGDTAMGTGLISFNNGNIFSYGADHILTNAVDHDNNTTMGFLGDYSLTFSQSLVNSASANNFGWNNNIVAGKSLSFGGMTADLLTANRIWTIDGSGETILNGNITSSTAFGLILTKTGNGTVQLNGTGSNFNKASANIDIDRGILRLGASGVIGDGAGFGDLTFTPEAISGDVATFDLNGQTETINGITANSDGTAIIDNTSASAASLIFGANNATVTFGGGVGTYTITDSGAGALSITKTGTANTVIPTGVTLTYQGSTNVNGGSLTIASAVDGTTGLNVTNSGSLLRLSGGISDPTAISSIVVEDGATLSLLDGAGNKISNLSNLQLGSSGGSLTTLNLNVGDLTSAGDELNTDLFTLSGGGTLSLFSGNQIRFNLTDIGLNENETYDLLNASGGFTTGNLSALDYLLGATPGGFSSISLTATDSRVYITTGTLIEGNTYWRGLTDTTWNASANNWAQDKAGATPALSTPGQGTNVFFAFNGVGTGPLVTTLEQNFKVRSLTFEAGTTTPSSVTIAPGAVATNRIEIAPQTSTDGIRVSAGGPAVVTISGAVRLGSNQTWDVVDVGTVLSLGSLLGEADVTKTGAGKVTLSAAADPIFNAGATAGLTISGGTVEMLNRSGLGDTINSNLVAITVGSTGVFYLNNSTATTALAGVGNSLNLAGGTLSLGGANHFYNGPVTISADSFLNLRDSNSTLTSTAARNLTLSDVLTGTGKLTVDSSDALSSGNQISGTLTLSNDNSAWSGGFNLLRGTVLATHLNALGTGAISAGNSRIQFNATANNIWNLDQNVTVDAPGGILELSVDAQGTLSGDLAVNLNGIVTIGSAANANNALRILQATDNFSVIDFTDSVVLGNHASISVSGSTTRSATISGIISGAYDLTVNDDLGGWAQTNRALRVTGANTFSGNVNLASGTLEFTTASNIGGGPSSLGQGSAISVTGSSVLSFLGTSVQSTNRPISVSAGTLTLSANGTGTGTEITYAGAITTANTVDGSNLILSGTPGSKGAISGGFTQTGDLADATVNGGIWTHLTGTTRIADDLTITLANTVLNLDSGLFQVRDDITVNAGATLNLNGPGVLSFNTATLSADATLNINDGATVNLGADNAVVATEFDRLFIAQSASGATAVLNMNSFNLTTSRPILGERLATRNGVINGSGTLTITGGDIDLYEGTINANLASTGTIGLEKFGPGIVTLKGDNSGLGATGATLVDDGTLVLDFTANNATKLRILSALDMRGGTLQIAGNGSAATAQTVTGFTLASGGDSTIEILPTGGQDAVIHLGAITRANNAQDGALRIILPSGVQSSTNGVTTSSPNSTSGLLGNGASSTNDAAYATVQDSTGTWFATKSGSNIVGLVSTAKNDVATWSIGDHITDETSEFTGTLPSAAINSLRWDASGGSDLVVAEGGVLLISSGGVLVTDQVGGTPSLVGGTLASGATELVFTIDSTPTFTVDSDIRIDHRITKAGVGTMRLTGNNTFTGYTEIQDGILEISGGNAIGDTSLVTLANSTDTTLRLLSDETIGRLQGGRRNDNSDYGTVDIGTNALTINQSASTTYAGFFTGSGILRMNRGSVGNLNITNLSTGFTGIVEVNGGMLQLSGAGRIDASVIRIGKGGALVFDNNSTTRSGTRILDTTAITLNSADGTFSGQTIVRGLAIRTDQNANTSETIGDLNFASGANYLSGEGDVGTGTASSFIIANDFVRLNNATFSARGRALGDAAGERNQFRIGTTANESAFIATLVGGGGIAGTTTISIVPWGIGEVNTGSNGALTDANMGNSLLTYTGGTGLRPLNLTTEFNNYSAAGATDNVRENRTSSLTGLSGATINSFVINNAAVSALEVTGAGASETLNVTSGALLFTLSGGANSTAYTTTLGGFDPGINAGGGEYIIHVVNPSSAATTSTLTAEISSPLTSVADITKSGRGTLVLSGTNTAGGGAKKTTINEGILDIAGLNNIGGTTGKLVFAGGTLRLRSGFSDDISQREIIFQQGGGTIETPTGVSVALANSVGSGFGGWTKTGTGSLTLNAAATYTGPTVISAGTVTVGADDALGQGGDLSVAGGATLALGTNNITAGLFTTTGASPVISGTGTINAQSGYFFNNTGNIAVDAALSGSGSLTKAQTNVLTLTGANTYSGTTEILSGTLSFTSIGNVGGGASALGAPQTVEDGTIRMGLTSTATTLTYTGTGSSSDRNIEMQGTTGGLTTNGNGTGALELGRIQTATAGTKTLTLGGTSSAGLVNTVSGIREVGATLALTKTGANTWALTGTNTYSGATTVSAGILKLGNGGTGATLPATSVITVASGASFAVDRSDTATQGTDFEGTVGISGAGNFRQDGSGTTILTAANSYTGSTTVAAGTLQIGDGGSTGTIGSGSVINEGTLAVNRNNAYTLANSISGSGAFEQNGTGTTILTAANSYTGETAVNSGTLYINGNQSTATGNVTVSTGATLASDNGQIGGDTTINGTLDSGSAPLAVGVINFAGATTDLTLANGSTWLIDIVQGGVDLSDTVNVGGLLTIGAMDPTFNFTGPFTEGTKYTVATYTSLSGSFSSYLDSTVYTLGGGDYLFNYNDGGAITLTAVPEPGTLSFLGLGLGAYFFRRLRKRRIAAVAENK